ncbi:MAG: class I SAM-dependent methyltransferase [Candidatus Omnitrophica bacterium]|nr:class I SAM-dependent methyltransferase [Candidatus Omnitrophota bacterium]
MYRDNSVLEASEHVLLKLACVNCHIPLDNSLKCHRCGFTIQRKSGNLFDYSSFSKTYNEGNLEPWNLESSGIILRRLKSFDCPLAISENYILKYIKKLDVNKNSRLLELGLFSSAILHYFSLSKGTFGVGVDLSETVLKKQSEVSEILGSGTIYFLGDCYKLPFCDDSFDYIFCLDLLEHIPKVRQLLLLKECFRILNSNGKMIIKIPIEKNKRFSFEILQSKLSKKKYARKRKKNGHLNKDSLSLPEFKEMVKDVGLKMVCYDNIGFFFDYIYDNYLLAFKDRLFSSKAVDRNLVFSGLLSDSILKKTRFMILRMFYYMVRFFAFFDRLFCGFDCGANFICLLRK